MNKFNEKVLLFLKGMGMGSADIVPGVSGGSIALITKIYEELLSSINSFDIDALKLLAKFDIVAFWKHVNASFLLTLFLGILTSIFAFSKAITFLIDSYPIPLWSFFCGLILISAIIILRDIKRWNIIAILMFPIGVVIAYFITELPMISSPNNIWFTFISGAIAICAMILPGISGSFLLLILGKYEYILHAVNEKDFVVLAVFALGCITGLLLFSRLISWFLKNYHAITLSFLSGFMIGSINKIWPWKKILSYRMSSSGDQKPFLTENILPHVYLTETGQEPAFLVAILAFLIGVILVVGLERVAYNFRKE
jgi:putative membrane protein|tara:strand:+ start:552 stop:1487 length:936 start_codon:yes stop_codon:yes gene_type:complete